MARFIYIILLIAAAIFYPLYSDRLSLILLAALIAVPFLLAVQLLISRKRVRGAVNNAGQLFMNKGTEGEVCFELENSSPFPLSGCEVCIRTEFMPTGAVSRYKALIPLPAKEIQTLAVNVGTEHCGKLRITLEYIRIFDLLHVFSSRISMGNGLYHEISVIPAINADFVSEADRLMSLPPADNTSEDETPVNTKNGSPGDVCGFREFAPGDRVTLLHHKLSARFDKDIVKILSVESGNRYLLTADLSCPDDEGLEERDQLLEKLVSIAFLMGEKGAEVYAAVGMETDRSERLSCGACAIPMGKGAELNAAAAALAASDIFEIEDESGFICCPVRQEHTERINEK